MKYFLVEVKKAFGIYPLKAQIVMRSRLVNGIYKDNVKVIKELSADELEKEYSVNVKYRVEKEDTVEDEEIQTPEDSENEETVENDVTPTVEIKTTPEVEKVPENENLDDLLGNAGTLETEDGEVVAYEDMKTEDLLQIANETYKLNKPVNTGRENLLNSLNAIKNA